ncbi:MAG: hypothetical protein RLQ12_23360 [Cyclobacteriaceae bacterium]
MKSEEEELFLEYINAIAHKDYDLLNQLIHPEAVFEFPYAVPGRPETITGRSNIIDSISSRPFNYSFLEPLYIESINRGEVLAEILSEETYNKSEKSYSQHMICKGTISEDQVSYYREFFNPITRLRGLLDLDDDNIIILND